MNNPLTPSQPTEGFSLEEVVAFLRGERPLDGLNYGEREPGRLTFWWRKHLMAALAAHNAEVERRVVEARIDEATWWATKLQQYHSYEGGGKNPFAAEISGRLAHLSQPKEQNGGKDAK